MQTLFPDDNSQTPANELFADTSNNIEQTIDGNDLISCCSRYRQCSDERKCVIPETDYAPKCIYRKNLEKGIIYYGKNAHNFSNEIYKQFLSTYDLFDESLKNEFHNIIEYFCHKKRCIQSELWYHSPFLQQLADLGLIVLSSCGEKELGLYNIRFLEKSITDSTLKEQWKKLKAEHQALAKKNKVKLNIRPILISWLFEHSPDTAGALTSKFRNISLSAPLRNYFFELYYDKFHINPLEFTAQLPKKHEANFIKSVNN